MRTKKKGFLSILLSLTLLLGLLPGMSLTAYAAEKSETISLIGEEYSRNQTATGTHFKVTLSGSCYINDLGAQINKFGPMTVSSLDETVMTKVVWSYSALQKNANTLSASTGTYNGNNTVTGINSTSLTISSSIPAGVYLSSITIYYDVAHTHTWATAWSHDATYHWHACTGEGASDACLNETGAAKATHTYGDTGDARFTCTVCEYVDTTKQAEAGLADQVVIQQVMSEVSAKTGSGMTYTGNPIQLINTPTTALPTGYTMKYAVTTENTAPTDDSLYTTSIPAKTDAGTYYVWYKVTGDESHIDTAPKCIQVKISKAITKVTVNAKTASAKAVDKAVKKAGAAKSMVETIVLGKKVKKISKGAFKKFKKVKTLIVKTKKLKKAKVKKSLKGSKITKIKVDVGSKKMNKKYVKKYKKIFKKKNSGKKVKVTL